MFVRLVSPIYLYNYTHTSRSKGEAQKLIKLLNVLYGNTSLHFDLDMLILFATLYIR